MLYRTVKKIPLFTIFLLLGISTGYAQDSSTASKFLKKEQLKGNINILGTDISYERRIGKNISAYFEGGLTFGFFLRGGSLYQGEKFGYGLAPFLSTSLRWYYNLKKRNNAGRNIKNNAANFINVKAGYRFAPIAHKNIYANPAVAIVPSWGFQRNLGKHFSFELLTGYSFLYGVREKYWGGNVSIKFKVGYIIF